MTNQDYQILVVEDSPRTSRLVRSALKAQSYEVLVAHDGRTALEYLARERIDLMILDLGLPDMDGLDVLNALRARQARTPALILSAREAVEDRVRGLDSGADDYVIKPFEVPELQARVRTLLRRRESEEIRLTCGDLVLDQGTKSLTREGQEIFLAPREHLLIEYLLKHKGEVITRSMLARDVWKFEALGTSMDNMIDVQISRLREKIDKPFATKLLHTIRGVGFALEEPE